MATSIRPRAVTIVTPALADANNGNWQTARRWAAMLSGDCAVRLCRQWPDGGAEPDVLIALHARRSAPSVAAWAQAHPTRPLLLALTGTDLYRDIAHDPQAHVAPECAQRLGDLVWGPLDELGGHAVVGGVLHRPVGS